MFFVIAFHFSDHGNVIVSCAQEVTFNWAVLAIVRIFGAICNCAFMLISGYFFYQKRFNFKNIFRLWLEVWFYSVIIGIICYILKTEPFTIKSLIKMLFPFTFNQYWFFSTYIVIYMFFPFFNRLIDGLSKRQHQTIIVLGIFFISFFSTFTHANWIIGTNNISIFAVLYVTGAYLNKYDVCVFKRKIAIISVFLIALEIISIFGMRVVYRYTGMDSVSYFVWGTHKILPVLTSIALFLLFKQVRIRHTKIISLLSSSVFGVYLFHIGRLNVFLFQKLFDDSATYNTGLLFPQMIAAMCSIFAIGILFDKIRICLFEKPVLKILNSFLDKINDKLQEYYPC